MCYWELVFVFVFVFVFVKVTCVLLGACTTLAIFLAATTVYYRRKAHQLQVQNKVYMLFVFVFLYKL